MRAAYIVLPWPILVAVLAACNNHDQPPSGMQITVQKLDPDGGCYQKLPGGDTLDPAIKLTDLCDAGAATGELKGGADKVRLIISYGDLKFNSSTTPPQPTVTTTLDGVASTPAGVSIAPVQTANPTAFSATFVAPSQPVSVMQVGASVVNGFGEGPIGPYVVDAPQASVLIEPCLGADAGTCQPTAGVGSALVSVTAPGSSAITGTVTSFLNGIPQPGSAPVQLAPVPGSTTMVTGTSQVAVPQGPDGTLWTVNAQVGSAVGTSPSVTLRAPVVTVGLDACGGTDAGSCQPVAGVGMALVSVNAPGTASTTMGVITSSLNGVLQPGSTPIALMPVPGSTSSVTGVTQLPVPVAFDSALWSVSAQVGGGTGTSQAFILHQPTVVASVAQCAVVDAGSCSVVADVGTVAVQVTAPGTVATTGAILSTLGGVLQPSPGPVMLSPAAVPNTVTGVAYVPVPSAADGVSWSLGAQVGTTVGTAATIRLKGPTFTAALGTCTSGECGTVLVGQSLVYSLTAPLGISPPFATVFTLVNDTAAIAPLNVSLSTVDNAHQTLTGTVTLTVPAVPNDAGTATWIINANVGGYNAQSVTATIQ